MSTSTFVAMELHRALWGIHAQIVQAIVADREWEGAPPFDMAQALGIAVTPGDPPHPVLLLGSGEKPAAVRAFGTVILRQVEMTSVWAVPPLVRSPSKRQTVSAVAFAAGELPLLVLDPIALLAMAGEHFSP